ncbi:HAD family phosphatase [Cryomorphaceae bacterium 1068]|nr:HAD family phosphatase [Cryomorphaceae bacterium 1068]
MIKNIIFDLGVVLLDVNYQHTIDAFASLGLEKPEEAFSKQIQDEFFRHYERGQITESDFLMGLSARTGRDDIDELRNAWCKMLGELPQAKFHLIKRLSSVYRLFILSNTNQTHQLWFEKKIDEQYGWRNFSECFEFIGYSHLLNQRKPDKEAFQFILNEYGLTPKETLFVDDTMEHIEGARGLGVHVLHYNDGEDLEELVQTFIKSVLTSF